MHVLWPQTDQIVCLWYRIPYSYYSLNFSIYCTFSSLLSFRLAESYSQLVKYYLETSMDVDKRLNWQVKEVAWKGKTLLQGNSVRLVVRSF